MNVEPYVNFNAAEVATLKNVPMEHLDRVMFQLKEDGFKVRVRYRGSRTNPEDLRSRKARYRECAKKFANRFSVYDRTDYSEPYNV